MVLEADIFGCFDNISHKWMLSHIPIDKNILRKWLKAGYLNKNVFYPTDDGTPPGGIISPVLANLVLDGLENKLRTRKGEQGLVNLVRYADDFISATRAAQVE